MQPDICLALLALARTLGDEGLARLGSGRAHHRLLFRTNQGAFEIVELVSRQGLEQARKRHA